MSVSARPSHEGETEPYQPVFASLTTRTFVMFCAARLRHAALVPLTIITRQASSSAQTFRDICILY